MRAQLKNHLRSVLKGVTWRIVASLTTFILVYIFTGDWVLTAQISAIEVTLKIFFYYVHERAWGRVHWGLLGPEPNITQSPK